MAAWPMVALGGLLRFVPRSLSPEADTPYREIGIRSHGRGIFHKPPVTAADIGNKRVFYVEPGDFVLNIVFAWEGAVAVVGEAETGMIVSHRFPTFQPDPLRLDVKYLRHYFRTAPGLDLLGRVSPGGAGRNRTLNRTAFLEQSIPLPPLSEQRRIIAMLDQMSAKVDEAKDLRKEVAGCTDLLMAAEERRLWPLSSIEKAPTLAEVTRFLARGRQSEQGASDHVLIKTQHVQQGRYVPSLVRLAPHVAQKVHPDAVAQEGDILVACSAAGCLGRVARYEGDGREASTDTHIAIVRPNPDIIEPDYLYAYLLGAQGQHQLRSRERGDWRREKIGFRLTELNLKDMRAVPVPLPSRHEQRRIVGALAKLRGSLGVWRRLQDATLAEINALVPAVLDRAFKGEL